MIALVLGAALAAAPVAAPADVPPCPSADDKPDVEKLVKRTESILSGRSSISVMTMSIKTQLWSRKIKMKVWSKGTDDALVRVLEGGPHETGMMTLKREKQLWNYLPQAGRVMKLPSGMLGDSWMGSDFTNDDLVKGSSLSRDFDSKVDGTPEVDGKKAWHITLTPKKDAVIVWGKIEMLVDRASCIPLEQKFFDEANKPVRSMAFSDIKDIGWRRFPMKMVVTPAEAGRETQISYDSIEFDADIKDDTFSLHRLQQEH